MKIFKKFLIFTTLLTNSFVPLFCMMPNLSSALPQIPLIVPQTSSAPVTTTNPEEQNADSVATPEPEQKQELTAPAEDATTTDKPLTPEEQDDTRNYWIKKFEKEKIELLNNLEHALQDQDEKKLTRIMTEWNFNDLEMLYKALKRPTLNYDLIQLLLDNGTRLCVQDIGHLITADNVEFIQFLIDHHFTVHHWSDCSSGPNCSGLHLIMREAIDNKACNIVKVICNNALLSDADKDEALDCALRQYNISHDIIKFLLEHGARITTFFHFLYTKEDVLPLLFSYPIDQNIKDEVLKDSCEPWKIAERKDLIKLLLAHGAVPTQLDLVYTFRGDHLDIAELILQHPAITTQIKNDLLGECGDSQEKMELLIKYGAQISETTFFNAIRHDCYYQVKFYLESGAGKITKDILAMAMQSRCSDDMISLLFNHGATIPFGAERTLLHHKNAAIVAKILSTGVSKEQNKIKEATDLTLEQKELLLNAFAQLNLIDIFVKHNYESLKSVSKLNVPAKLLLKYFPLGLWINERHEGKEYRFKNLDCLLNPFETQLAPEMQYCLKNAETKKKLTLTESLLANLASQRQTLGENAIFAGKDPKDEATITWNVTSNYYKAGFAGDLLQTNILDQIIHAEKELGKQGFETFFSGRAWEWNFVNDVWNMIVQIKTGENNQDKISLRFRNQSCDILQLQIYRHDLVKNGAAYHIGTGTNKTGKESEVTFMNKTIISNPGYHGECTGTYFIDNCSIAGKNTGWTMVEKLFTQEGLEWYFKKHKKELKALYDQHEKTNSFGELLCIAVKKDSVDKMVYPAKSGGFKKPERASFNIHYLKFKILILNRFLDTDHTFYCFAVSDIPGEYGTKYTIKSLHVANPKKYAAYKKARDAFAAKMKADLQP